MQQIEADLNTSKVQRRGDSECVVCTNVCVFVCVFYT